MRFQQKRAYQYDDDSERPPEVVGLRDRIVHFTW
jgi:hypothetical protein